MFLITLDCMARECTAYERKEKCVQSFGRRNLKKRGNLDDLGIDVCMTLNFKKVKQSHYRPGVAQRVPGS